MKNKWKYSNDAILKRKDFFNTLWNIVLFSLNSSVFFILKKSDLYYDML